MPNILLRFIVVGMLISGSLTEGFADGQTFGLSVLSPGPYQVGYAVQHHYDYSRTYLEKTDSVGRPARRETARPIQISIWYPAEAPPSPRFIPYGEYVDSLITELVFDKSSDLRKQQFLNGIRIQAFGPEGGNAGDQARLEQTLRIPCAAIRDARPLGKGFPLILYAPSIGREAFENSVLCEFLASHGYVVAAFPCNGFVNRLGPNKAYDVEMLVRDAEFVMERMKGFPNVDPAKTGVIGYSWGGTVSQFLAARNTRIDARVGMDGAEIAPQLDEAVRKSFPFYPLLATTQTPSLVMVDAGSGRQADLSVYDGIKYADTVILRFHSIGHVSFQSLSRLSLVCREAPADKEIEKFDIAYGTICRYILNFLNARLKSDAAGAAFLTASPESNGIPEGLLTVESRKGAVRPPLGEEFLELRRTEGAPKAREALAAARAVEKAHSYLKKALEANPDNAFAKEELSKPATKK